MVGDLVRDGSTGVGKPRRQTLLYSRACLSSAEEWSHSVALRSELHVCCFSIEVIERLVLGAWFAGGHFSIERFVCVCCVCVRERVQQNKRSLIDMTNFLKPAYLT